MHRYNIKLQTDHFDIGTSIEAKNLRDAMRRAIVFFKADELTPTYIKSKATPDNIKINRVYKSDRAKKGPSPT